MPSMKNQLLLTYLVSCLSMSVSTSANEKPFLEAYVGGGIYSLDKDRDLDSFFSKEGGLEVPINTFLSLETWLSDYSAEYKKSSDELDSQRFYTGALLHLKRRGKKRPFISAGFSHLEYENNAGHDSSESLINIGIGVKRYYSNNITLRGEMMMMNSVDKELIDMGARLALGYVFKYTPAIPVIVPEPIAKPIAKSEPEPEPVVVKSEPLPVDSDNDGIIDGIDQCPGTNPEFKVDEIGCAVMLTETVSITMDIKFQFNSAEISAVSLPEVEKVADFMKQFDQTVLTVEGHSDDSGPAIYNKFLSQQRADAVRASLVDVFSLSPERVSAVGFGEESPIADNSTKEGRAINRRVVAVVESSIERASTREDPENVAAINSEPEKLM